MSNLSSPTGELQFGQSADGDSQENNDGLAAPTVNKPSSPKSKARQTNFDERVNFIHEPEEQFALFDPKLYLKILFPGVISEMATTKAVVAEENRSYKESTKATSLATTFQEKTDFKQPPQFLENGEPINENEDKVSDLTTKNYPTDGDVLKAISQYSNDLDSDAVLKRVFTPPTRTVDKTTAYIHCTDNSTEYWSDEECRYPPQMSLSPPPGHFRGNTLEEKTWEEKETERERDIESVKNKEIKKDFPKAHLHKKLAIKKTLSPIILKTEHHIRQMRSPACMSPFHIPTGSSSPTSSTSHQYNWKARPTEEEEEISPSLVRPILATTPRLRKEKYFVSESIFFDHGQRMRDDKLSIDSKRYMTPKRQVSRSLSSSTASTSRMFPEIPTISKTQGSSRSISDFRQSSSIFGKLVKKNSFKGTLDDRGKAKAEKQDKTISQGSDTPSGNSKVNESTRRKIRRILSLN